MVDLGGVSVPELSQDLKDGFLDINNLRPTPASASNPLATLADTTGAIFNLIVKGKVTSNKPDFISLPSGLTFRLLASASVPFQYYVSGVLKTLVADVDLTVTDAAHNFVYVDPSGTLGRSALPCLYAFVAPGGPATGQHWFDLGSNKMKSWDGAAWVPVDHIFVGYVRADGGAINARSLCEGIGVQPMERYAKFQDGSDGFLDVSSGTTTLDGLKRYTAVIVRGSGKIVHTALSSTLLEIYSQSIIGLIGTVGIDVSGLGALGTDHLAASPGTGTSGGLGGAGGGGGKGGNGGGRITLTTLTASGGGTHDVFTNGLVGSDSALIGNKTMRDLILPYGAGGARGGTTGGGPSANAGTGGNGGGYVHLQAPSIAVGASASIHADGAVGGTAFGDEGGGGGGGGGIVEIRCRHLVNDGAITAAGGGAGPGGPGDSRVGGAGGAGAVLTSAA